VRTRVAVTIWTLGVVVGGATISLALRSDHADKNAAMIALPVLVGLAFIASGLIAAFHRPENRTGLIMIVTGFAWYVGALADSNYSLPATIGFAFGALFWGFFGWLVLSFPSGRLETLYDRLIVGGAFAAVGVGIPLYTLFNDLRDDAPEGAPANAFLIDHKEMLSGAIDLAVNIVGLALIAGAVSVLAGRWRGATPPLRRALAPVFATGGLTLFSLAAAVSAEVLGLDALEEAFTWLTRVALLTVPIAFLLGLLRTRLARASVGRLLLELGEVHAPGDLRDALARALGDPSLTIAYPIGDDNYVDVEGNHVDLPDPSTGRVTMVEREGRCIAALVHDASLAEDRELVDAVTAAAGLALENERRLAELAGSEARNRALLDAIPDLMFRLSKDGTYLDAKGDESLIVAPAEELLGSNVYDVLPVDVADRIMRCARNVLDRGGIEPVEYQLRIGPLDRHFEARVVKSGADEVLLIVRDISDRKRAEAQLERLQDELRARFDELQRERDFIRTVVQAAPSFFCLVDPEGRIVRFNRTLEEACGRVDDERTRGKPFWSVFIAPDECPEACEAFTRSVATGSSAEYENHWVTADGDRLLVAWQLTPLLDQHGQQRYLITGIDITERKRHEEEIRRSRARIVEIGDIERRRLERNLHDGAQQRLVSVSLSLRLAHAKLRESPDEAERILTASSEELARALEELRELARGIHPAVLTDRGLGAALEALVTRTPIPVDVQTPPDDRLPEPVEAAAYYVVSEALANIAKYANASGATVRVSRNDGRAIVEVEDDGVGGADPSRGSGLRGLADRIEALDGHLEIESAPGRGTTIRAEIPVS
jgi:PAS domain S-box-containing protein